MNKKLLLIGLCMILMIPSALAVIGLDNGYAYWPFDNNATEIFHDNGSGINSNVYTASAKVGSHAMDASSIAYENATAFTNIPYPITNVSTISFWFNPQTTGADAGVFSISDGGAYVDELGLWYDGGGNLEAYHSTDSTLHWSQDIIPNGAIDASTGIWMMITYIHNTSGSYIFVNDTLEYSTASGYWMPIDFDGIYFNGGIPNRGPADGFYDNFVMDTEAWFQEDIDSAWNGGAGDTFILSGSSPVGENVTVNLLTPTNNDANNTATQYFTYNVTSKAGDLANTSLWTNSTGVWVLNTTDLTPVNDSKNTFTVSGLNQGDILWNVEGCDVLGNCTFADSNFTFILDTVGPVEVNNFVNGSSFFNQNITGTFNFTDDNLIYSVNLSINGTQIFGVEAINNESYQYNLSYNYSLLAPGEHVLSVRSADAHTAQRLKAPWAYNPKNGWFNDYLEFNFDNPYKDGSIRIEQKGGSWFDTWESVEEFDRFKFRFKPNTKKSSYTFTVTSDDKIDIIEAPNTIYKKWLIYNEHWLDFMPYTDVEFNRISDNEVEVTVNGVDSNLDIIEFNSIGDLNVVTTNYTFYNINVTSFYLDEVMESEIQNVNFTIQGNDGNLATTGAIYFADVAQTTTKTGDNYTSIFTTPGITNESEIKTINVSFTIDGTPYTQQFNQTVYKINIGDCSNSSWAEALTFISRDEETDGNLNNLTLNIDMDVWFESESVFRNFNFSFTNSPNHTICIYPNATTYLVNAVAEYQNEDEGGVTYDHRKYYLDNYTLQQSNDTIYLYNIDDSKSSDVVLKVYDQSTGNPISGAFVKILRYYPGDGTYKVVEIEKTDTGGQTLAKMVLVDVFYKYIVEYDRTVVLDSSVEKVLTTTKLLPVSLTEDVLESFGKIGSVATSVTCTNSTLTCRFTWSDTQNIVQSATFNIWRVNGFGQTLIHTNTTSAVAGTMTYVISETISGNTYLAKGIIHTNTEFSDYPTLVDKLIFGDDINNWGGLSILFPVLLLLIVISFALIGVGVTGIIVGSLTVLLVASILGWLPLSIWSVMTFVILGGILIAKIKN